MRIFLSYFAVTAFITIFMGGVHAWVDFNRLRSESSNPHSIWSHLRLWKGDVTELNTDSITCGSNPLWLIIAARL